MDGSGTRFRRAPTALWRNVGADVLVGAANGESFEVLSGTAGDVWRLLEGRPTLRELTDVLGEVYDAPRDVIAADVAALLEELQRRGLVDVVAADRE